MHLTEIYNKRAAPPNIKANPISSLLDHPNRYTIPSFSINSHGPTSLLYCCSMCV